MTEQIHNWLLQLTALPTATGREDAVMAWVQRWAAQRRGLRCQRDAVGNLVLAPGTQSAPPRWCVVAHTDHPACVVEEVRDARTLSVSLRGTVHRPYLVGARVRLWQATDVLGHGLLTDVPEQVRPSGGRLAQATVRLDADAPAVPGQVVTWDLPTPAIVDGRLHAPACDNLAGVAAALGMLDRLIDDQKTWDGMVLLTRAEEVGWLGCIAACEQGTIPDGAAVLVLEASKASAETPLGAGPVLRVGDAASIFDDALADWFATVGDTLQRSDPRFAYQRRLMAGGRCEATAAQAMGRRAGCLCLPLANYHNMPATPGRLESEAIDLADFDRLVAWLVALATDPGPDPDRRRRAVIAHHAALAHLLR